MTISSSRDGVCIEIRVVPRAGKAGIAGTRNGALVVRLNAAPVDGAANAELIAVLSEALGVPRRNITLESGERSRTKRVRVVGMTADDVRRVLNLSSN